MYVFLFFFKQKTAYEMRISDWSSDVCSSDLDDLRVRWRWSAARAGRRRHLRAAARRARRGCPAVIDFGLVVSLIAAIGAPALLAARWSDGDESSSFLDDVTAPLLAGDRKSTRLNSSH